MASIDSSFDVVSEVDMQEVDNAYQQTTKELVQRYDLKDSHATIELDKAKGMHDELERVYRPYMDFSALTEYTDGVISSLFD